MPTRLLLGAVSVAVLLVIGLWSAGMAIGSLGLAEFRAGLIGIAVAAVVGLTGILILTPWKKRAIADWMTMWLAGTVFRMLATPIAAYLLYSAVSPVLAAKPFGLAVALTYIVTLFVEAAVVARYMNGIASSEPGHG